MEINAQKGLDYIPADFESLLTLDIYGRELMVGYYKAAIAKTQKALALYPESHPRRSSYQAYIDTLQIELDTLEII